MSSIFFTADPHFGHKKIIEHCKRPFTSLEHMHQVLIDNWNSVVTKQDLVYLLGDVFLDMNQAEALRIRRMLNGNIVLIEGNHDDIAVSIPQAWASIHVRKLVSFKAPFRCRIILDHFSMETWKGSHSGTWMLHGHSHGTLPENPNHLKFDVGVDCWNFTPISLETVVVKMQKKLQARAAAAPWAFPEDYIGSNCR